MQDSYTIFIDHVTKAAHYKPLGLELIPGGPQAVCIATTLSIRRYLAYLILPYSCPALAAALTTSFINFWLLPSCMHAKRADAGRSVHPHPPSQDLNHHVFPMAFTFLADGIALLCPTWFLCPSVDPCTLLRSSLTLTRCWTTHKPTAVEKTAVLAGFEITQPTLEIPWLPLCQPRDTLAGCYFSCSGKPPTVGRHLKSASTFLSY